MWITAGPTGRAYVKLEQPGKPGEAEKVRVQRREILLIVLLAVLVLLFASITADRGSGIIAGQKAQAERLNDLDEEVLGAPGAETEPDDK